MISSLVLLVHEDNTTITNSPYEKQKVPSIRVSLRGLITLSDTKSFSLSVRYKRKFYVS